MIIGLDVGTSMTKADAYDDDGSKLASAERASRLDQDDDGRVEQDLEDVLASAADVVRRVVEEAGRPVRAVAITGQGDGLWLRDADGYATRPPISWLDDRAADTVRAWQADGTVQRVYGRTLQANVLDLVSAADLAAAATTMGKLAPEPDGPEAVEFLADEHGAPHGERRGLNRPPTD